MIHVYTVYMFIQCIYIYGIHMYVYIYICMLCIYICLLTYIYIYVYIYICISISICIYIYTHVYIYIHVYIHICIQYTYMYTHMHIYIYVYIYIHIHIHMYVRRRDSLGNDEPMHWFFFDANRKKGIAWQNIISIRQTRATMQAHEAMAWGLGQTVPFFVCRCQGDAVAASYQSSMYVWGGKILCSIGCGKKGKADAIGRKMTRNRNSGWSLITPSCPKLLPLPLFYLHI